MNDAITIPMFDPSNPDDFEELSFHEERSLEGEQYEVYMQQKQRHRKHLYKLQVAEVQKFRVLDQGRPYSYDTPDHEWLVKLAVELCKHDGYSVEYWREGMRYGRPVECHPTWATKLKIFIGSEQVGSVVCWHPTTSYRVHTVGWKIYTNRYTDSRTWDDCKRLKKLESAVDHIVKTTSVTDEIEAKLEKASKKARALFDEFRNMEQYASKAYGFGVIGECLSAILDDDEKTALAILRKHAARYTEQVEAAANLKRRWERHVSEVLVPLKWEAYDRRPDLYAEPIEPRPENKS